MKNILIVLCCLVFTIDVSAQKNYKEAREAFDKNQFKKAYEKINQDISERGLTDSSGALRSEILMYVNADQCWESIQETIKKFPESAEGYRVRGMFYYEIKDLEKAYNDYTTALKYSKNDSMTYGLYLNRSGTCPGDYSGNRCVDDAKSALAIRPYSLEAMNNLSNNLFHQGKSDESVELLLKMKKLNPEFPGIYINLGYQLQTIGKYDEAEKYLIEGIKLFPKEPYLYNNLGYAQFKLGKSDEAVKNINKSIQFNPTNSYCYRNLALIYEQKNDLTKMCEAVNKALQLKFTEMYGDEMLLLKQKKCL